MTRAEHLAMAESLLAAPVFTKELEARARGHLTAAELSGNGPPENRIMRRETRVAPTPGWFRHALRNGMDGMPAEQRAAFDARQQEALIEVRDMTSAGGAFPGSAGGFFTPLEFSASVWASLKAVDDLFDDDVITILETKHGGPVAVPNLVDTNIAAVKVAQGQQSTQDEPSMGALRFSTCPTWRSQICKASIELITDSGVPIDGLLAAAFAIRFARGIGAANVATLLAAATSGAIANGSSVNDGSTNTGANSIGSDDLYMTMSALDPAYLASPKCAWVMSYGTLIAIGNLRDSSGLPLKLIERHPVTGELELLHKPVRICPSMAPIGTAGSPPVGNVPIIFGDLSRCIGRRLINGMVVNRLVERWAEYGQVGFEDFLRWDFAVQTIPGGPSPIVYLANAA